MTGKLAATPGETFSMLANADMKFPTIKDDKGNDVQLSEGRYAIFMRSPDRALRERAFKKTLEAYLAFKNTMATTLAGLGAGGHFRGAGATLRQRARGGAGPRQHPGQRLRQPDRDDPLRICRMLHRYMEIRRKKLGIDKVHLYDTFVPLIDGEAPKIAFDDAVATIIKGLAPLGREYLDPMTKAFQSRWIDVYETQGKRSGAYSESTYSTHPYILLNYNDTYDDMFTTAHEMGHSMHSWFSQHNQPPVYGDYPIFLAEVASTSNEVILSDYLRKTCQERRGTAVPGQQRAGEHPRHRDQPDDVGGIRKADSRAGGAGRSAHFETMSKTYRDLVVKYFGPSFAYDDEVDGYWLRIPHFYRGFYVYKYATSYSASVALAKGVLERGCGQSSRPISAF